MAESREIGIDWVAAWPRVRRELLRHLSARVQPATLAEDLCQDVAEALVGRRGPVFGTEEHLFRWARRVAHNRHIDIIRRDGKHDLFAEPDDRVDHNTDIATTVEQRAELDHTIGAMRQLSARDVAVILTTDCLPPVGAAERNRLNVQRHRARRRLLALLEAGAAAVAAFALLVRRHLHVPVAPAAIVIVPVLAFSLHATEVRPRPHAADVGAATQSQPGRQLSSAVTLPAERPARAPAATDRGTSGTPIVSFRPMGDVGPGVDLYEPDHPLTLCFDHVPLVDAGCVDRPSAPPGSLPHP